MEKKDRKILKEMNNFLINYFKLLVFCLVIIILATGYFFLIKPKYDQIISQFQLLSKKKETEYQEKEKILQKLEGIKSEYQKISDSDMEKIKAILPEEKNHEELLAQLEKIIISNGFLFSSLQIDEFGGESISQNSRRARGDVAVVGEASGFKEVKKLIIKVPLIGTNYEGFKNILSAFENNLRLMDVTQLSFNPESNTTFLEVTAYFLQKN